MHHATVQDVEFEILIGLVVLTVIVALIAIFL
jgi:hypothetical protein